ncbi:cation diffusion facilitator family transporter [Bacillus sp. CGMCC 1.16541]|uniref:cation diffusion facilitator family transporter n=1 Tax=Bacillus sp. CGMCC 1.16541 TaxID=2185143 RepID=UPI000D73EE3B|nr:cation diffusion facilitator family transporter [Bacillus sp. CGMCC 1.16541]
MNQDYYKVAQKGAWVSIITYIVLSICKLTIGSMAHSAALRADGFNNLTDIIASVAVLIGLKISQKPRDEDHPYGHSRAENISSLLASFIMMIIGLQVLVNAGQSLFYHRTETPDLLAAWVGLVCAVIMIAVFLYNNGLAKQLKSQSLHAVAKDNLSDALVSVGAVVGVVGSQFGMPWLDTVAAVVVGLIICKTAFDIFKDVTHVLTDGFNQEELMKYEHVITEVEGVNFIKDLKGRMQGNYVMLEVTVMVDPHLNVIQSHEIADQIEDVMKHDYKIRETIVHIEPDVHKKKGG